MSDTDTPTEPVDETPPASTTPGDVTPQGDTIGDPTTPESEDPATPTVAPAADGTSTPDEVPPGPAKIPGAANDAADALERADGEPVTPTGEPVDHAGSAGSLAEVVGAVADAEAAMQAADDSGIPPTPDGFPVLDGTTRPTIVNPRPARAEIDPATDVRRFLVTSLLPFHCAAGTFDPGEFVYDVWLDGMGDHLARLGHLAAAGTVKGSEVPDVALVGVPSDDAPAEVTDPEDNGEPEDTSSTGSSTPPPDDMAARIAEFLKPATAVVLGGLDDFLAANPEITVAEVLAAEQGSAKPRKGMVEALTARATPPTT